MNQKTIKKQETKGLTYITFGEIIASFQTIYSNGTFTCSGNWSCLPLQTQLFLCQEEATCIYTVFFKYVYIYIFNAHLVSIQTSKVHHCPISMKKRIHVLNVPYIDYTGVYIQHTLCGFFYIEHHKNCTAT